MSNRTRRRKRPTLAAALAARYDKPKFDEEIQASLMDIPDFLNRKLWTEEDWAHNEEAWDEILLDVRQQRAQDRAASDKKIFAKVRRHNQIKTIKMIKRRERKNRRDEAHARRVRKVRVQGEQNDAVLTQLSRAPQTAAQIAKKLGFERRDVSKALRRLLKTGKAEKLSPKVYTLGFPLDPQRSSQKPKRKRTRLRDLR